MRGFSSWLWLPALLLLAVGGASAQTTVDGATGGGAVSADDFTSGTWTTLSGPVLTETNPGQLAAGGTIVLTAPAGWEFDTGGTAPTATVSLAPGFTGTTKLSISAVSRTSTTISITVLTASSDPPSRSGVITYANIRVRPTKGALPNPGSILNTGTTGPAGVSSYGQLNMVAGAPVKVRVETAAGGTGAVVSGQSRVAGSTLTVHAISRDVNNNFVSDVSAEWSLVGVTGSVAPSDLSTTTGQSTTFSANLVGSARLRATATGLASEDSGVLTVVPGPVAAMVIDQQPSPTATAGAPFAQQPVIRLEDAFTNLVTLNNSTQVTVARASGSGMLQGTLTRTASAGVVSFTDLAHNVATTIDLSFTSGTLPPVSSEPIMVSPAASTVLVITRQPSSTAADAVIAPPITLVLRDQFGNATGESGKTITASLSSGSGTLSGTLARASSGGEVTFDDLSIDEPGPKQLSFSGAGLTTATSSTFLIATEGEHITFLVEKAGGGSIADQTAGVPFDIRIEAKDGDGQLVEFTGDVAISSNGTLATGGGTVVMSDGVVEDHSVSFTETGTFTLTAVRSDDSNIWGSSAPFAVDPAPLSLANSTIDASESAITADGTSTTTIVVHLRDEFGNSIIESHTVTLANSGNGSLGPVSAEGDGTYTSTLTAPTTVGAATITASVSGHGAVPGDATVSFVHGPLAEFVVEASGGGSISSGQVAGVPFAIRLTARDAHGNTVTGFSGTASITSTGTLSAGATTAAFADGALASHDVTITSTGTFTLTATAASQSGTSNAFSVVAAAPHAGNSTLTIPITYLENSAAHSVTAVIQLRDAFGNAVTTDVGGVTVSSTSSNPPQGATLGAVSFDSGSATYRATLTASSKIEDVTVVAQIGGNALGSETVVITEVNRWLSAGQPVNRRTWNRAANWSLEVTPTPDHLVIIPAIPENGPGMPEITSVNPTIRVLQVEQGAHVVVGPGRTLTVLTDMAGEGTVIGDNATIVLGRHKTIANLNAATSTVTLNGTGTQTLSEQTSVGTLQVNSTVGAAVSDALMVAQNLIVASGRTVSTAPGSTIEVLNIGGGGTLATDASTLMAGGSITIPNIVLANSAVHLNGLTAQTLDGASIPGLREFGELVVNNVVSVTATHDVEVHGTLSLLSGRLIMESGANLVAPARTVAGGSLEFRRSIARQGWHMIASPLSTSYAELFDGITTQGYSGSSRGNGDQPNVMWFDETDRSGTTNQRWRAPANAADGLVGGRGIFFFVFGDVAGDGRYNDVLPRTLTVSGNEFHPSTGGYPLPVTWTAPGTGTRADSLDSGWNLLANPFGASIDWCDETKWTRTNVDGVIYLWDGSTYVQSNCANGDGTFKVAPFQGFWVKANAASPELTVDATARTANGGFHRPAQLAAARPPFIEMRIEAGGSSSTAHLTFTETGRIGADNRDGFLLDPPISTYAQLYFVRNDGARLSINNLPSKFSGSMTVPVGFRAFSSGMAALGEYALSWPVLANIPDHWTVELVDQAANVTVDMRGQESYRYSITRSNLSASALQTPLAAFEAGPEDDDREAPAPASMRAPFSAALGTPEEARFTVRITAGDDEGVPATAVLHQNYPNPFRLQTTLGFGLPFSGRMRLEVFDVAGRRVTLLAEGDYEAGFHEVEWNAAGLASGVYIARLVTEDRTVARRMVVIR